MLKYSELEKMTLEQLSEEENKEFAELNYPDLVILSAVISKNLTDATIFKAISKEEAFDEISKAYDKWVNNMSENRKYVAKKYDNLRLNLVELDRR